MAKLVSKTYGEALFELAVEQNTLDSISEEVEAVLQVLQTNEDFIKLMCHPRISVEEKSGVLENVFKDRVSDDLVGFLLAIESKGRFSEVEAILYYFVDRVREYKKVGVAQVTSAMPLSDQEKSQIEGRLLETTSYVSFCIDYKVDASLIGGMVIRIGDRVVDSSIKKELANMAKDLNKIQLAH